MATPPDFFAALDANSNGSISRDEAEIYFKRMAQAGAGGGAAGGKAARGSGGPSGSGAPAGSSGGSSATGVDAGSIFRSLDRDGDGRLSRSELAPIIEQANRANKAAGKGAGEDDFFGSMDADGSGFVDAGEAKAFFDEIGKMVEQEAKGSESGQKSEL